MVELLLYMGRKGLCCEQQSQSHESRVVSVSVSVSVSVVGSGEATFGVAGVRLCGVGRKGVADPSDTSIHDWRSMKVDKTSSR